MSVLAPNKMDGSLFQYSSTNRHLAAFKSGPSSGRFVVLIGGLSDGFMVGGYVPSLQKELSLANWGLVLVILSSSYTGYGIRDLDQDVLELDQLLRHLVKHYLATDVVFIGHSTGCQDSVHYMRRWQKAKTERAEEGSSFQGNPVLKGIILQAPVSDRESLLDEPHFEEMIAHAKDMVSKGMGDELMPRFKTGFSAPLSATRYLSLATKDGLDDMFSSDFSDAELAERLQAVTIPTLVVYSMSDQYVPAFVDKAKLVQRLCMAMPGARAVPPLCVENANHSLDGFETIFAKAVVDFLRSVVPA